MSDEWRPFWNPYVYFWFLCVKCKRAKGVGVVSGVVVYDTPSTAPTPALKLKVVGSQRISLDLLFGREQGISRIRAVNKLFAAARQGLARNDIFSRKSFELDQSVLAAQRMAMCVVHQSPVVKRHANTATILDICVDETNTRKPS
jgi:hypothetical protein